MVIVEINAKAETNIHPNKGPGTWQWGERRGPARLRQDVMGPRLDSGLCVGVGATLRPLQDFWL